MKKTGVLESLSIIYLTLPLLIFLMTFIRIEYSIIGIILLIFSLYKLIKNTNWSELKNISKIDVLLIFLALLCACFVSGVLDTHVKGDWAKHFAIINTLRDYSWPVIRDDVLLDTSFLRYYLGLYIVPSLLLKFIHIKSVYMIALWIFIGLSIFFVWIHKYIFKNDENKKQNIFLALLVFAALALFGGADIIGYLIERSLGITPESYEWWSGWAQYSSNMTALCWVPQHVLCAWISLILIFGASENENILKYFMLMGISAVFWSPFCTLGLIPLALGAYFYVNKTKIKYLKEYLLQLVFVGLPILIYMFASSSELYHSFADIFSLKGFLGYIAFIALEIGLYCFALFIAKKDNFEKTLFIISFVSLLLIPFYKMGIWNDFAMRVSLPALAVLSILSAKYLIFGQKIVKYILITAFVLGTPLFIDEIETSIKSSLNPGIVASDFNLKYFYQMFLPQYFSPLPNIMIKGEIKPHQKYKLNTLVNLADPKTPLKYFSGGISKFSKGKLTIFAREMNMKIYLDEKIERDLKLIMNFKSLYTISQTYSVSCRGEKIYFSILPMQKYGKDIQAEIPVPKRCVQDDALSLDFYFPKNKAFDSKIGLNSFILKY